MMETPGQQLEAAATDTQLSEGNNFSIASPENPLERRVVADIDAFVAQTLAKLRQVGTARLATLRGERVGQLRHRGQISRRALGGRSAGTRRATVRQLIMSEATAINRRRPLFFQLAIFFPLRNAAIGLAYTYL